MPPASLTHILAVARAHFGLDPWRVAALLPLLPGIAAQNVRSQINCGVKSGRVILHEKGTSRPGKGSLYRVPAEDKPAPRHNPANEHVLAYLRELYSDGVRTIHSVALLAGMAKRGHSFTREQVKAAMVYIVRRGHFAASDGHVDALTPRNTVQRVMRWALLPPCGNTEQGAPARQMDATALCEVPWLCPPVAPVQGAVRVTQGGWE